ncbi:MAG: molecular chaperone TorD family protein [Chloroflexota bacterium]
MTLLADQQMAYGLACKFLGSAFHKPIQPSMWQHILEDGLFENWMLANDDPFTARGLQLLTAFTVNADDTTLDVVERDYAALFVGPTKLKAPPWESVYLSRDHILFEKQTAQVRAFYAQYGLQTTQLHTEPDDHFGVELLFVAHLLISALAQSEDNPVGQAQMMISISQFLQAHLLQWSEPFLARVVYHAETDYYRGLAYVTAGMLSSLCRELALDWELEL